MSPRPDRAPAATLIQDCGLVRPSVGWWAWVGDVHFVPALLAAVPVWLALGLMAGGRMQMAVGWSALVSFLLVQPIVEELVFRGLLQGQLLRLGWARKAGPFTLANLCTTALFVASHFLAQPPAWALATAVPSLLFGHMRERFGSLLPSVILHVIYNAGFLLTAWRVHG